MPYMLEPRASRSRTDDYRAGAGGEWKSFLASAGEDIYGDDVKVAAAAS
jgi:hypothetical protein